MISYDGSFMEQVGTVFSSFHLQRTNNQFDRLCSSNKSWNVEVLSFAVLC